MRQAIKALTAALAPKARAVRNGKLEQIEASQLVPGDVILMAIGNVVPADVKLMGEEGDDVPMQVRFSLHDPCVSQAWWQFADIVLTAVVQN